MQLNNLKKAPYVALLFFIAVNACVAPPCKQDNAYNFDRWGRPIKAHKKKDPPHFLMKRCPKKSCKTRKIHCHGNLKYRGSPWWKNQNPAIGEDIQPYTD